MIENGYYVSVTPDVVYEEEIQCLVKRYPINKLMIETDGPWPFEGPFLGQKTHPNMMVHSIGRISQIKNFTQEEAAKIILEITQSFYQI
jgi:TatD DNase family protein